MKSLIIFCFIFFSSLSFAGPLEEAVTCSDSSGAHQVQLLIDFGQAEFSSWLCVSGETTVIYNNKLFDETAYTTCSKTGFTVRGVGSDEAKTIIFISEFASRGGHGGRIIWGPHNAISKVSLKCSFEKFDEFITEKRREGSL